MTSQQPVRGVGGLEDQVEELTKAIEHVFGVNDISVGSTRLEVRARRLFVHILHKHWTLTFNAIGLLINRTRQGLTNRQKELVWDTDMVWKYQQLVRRVCRYRTEGPYGHMRVEVERLGGTVEKVHLPKAKQTLENRTLGRTWV